jgi:hypothetical protein
MDPITMYADAWNASDASERRRLLEGALTEDCELIEPRGRFAGRDAIFERLTGFSDRFPGATVDNTTRVDEHNGFARYGWKIVGRDGSVLLEGLDVVARGADDRIERVVRFFGVLDPA